MTSGVKKRISSFLTERRSLRNAILKGSGERQAFAPWIALLKHRGVEEGGVRRRERRETDRGREWATNHNEEREREG